MGSNKPQWEVDVAVCQDQLPVNTEWLRRGICTILEGEHIRCATISVAVVDDETIQHLNREFLQHDYSTDVLSFRLDEGGDLLEGEVVVSAETARRQCTEFGWSAQCELLWYVLHGTLHLCGYDDQLPQQREEMEQLQQYYLQQLQGDPQLQISCWRSL